MHYLYDVVSRPKFWVRLHGVLATCWLIMAVPAVLFWRDSVAFIVLVSVYANFAGSVASWQAARTDRNSVDPEDFERLEQRVVALLRQVARLDRSPE